MIVNEIAKLENPLQARFSDCLYPSSARRFSSLSTGVVTLLSIRFAPPVVELAIKGVPTRPMNPHEPKSRAIRLSMPN